MFRATLLLADSAQVAEGKLYVLGGGWRLTGPQPSAMALAAILDIPSSEANRKISFEFFLVESSGRPVVVPGGTEIRIAGEAEVGPSQGREEGESLSASLALNLPAGALPLTPGRSYEWRLRLDGKEDDAWRLPFSVRRAD